MAHVLTRARWEFRWSRSGLLAALALLMLLIAPSAAPGQAGKADKAKDAVAAQAPDVADVPAEDPSRTHRIAPVEVFKDPNAEAILDIKTLKPLAPAPFNHQDYVQVCEQAKNPNLQPDRTLIDRVVRGLAAQLTDAKSIQSILDGPIEEAPKNAAGKAKAAPNKRQGDGGKTIQTATVSLLEPVFLARAEKNMSFLNTYRRSLHQYLPVLLRNHLIPRVQAMIVLGQAAYPTQDAIKLFQDQIESKTQALWVKLWAIEGISNIKKEGGRFSVDIESRTGLSVSKFLEGEREKELPWPIQMRGLEALGWLRQSGLPTTAARADMANTAMLFLANGDGKLEVRAEAARTLGLMQVNAVPKYNFNLVAYSAGLLAADIADQIGEQFLLSPPRSDNTKARYLTALLVGPVYQCFIGVEGMSNSGILQTARANANALSYSKKIFDLLQPLAQASVELLGAPTKEYASRKKSLGDRIQELRTFLKQNPPESRQLVEGGRQYGAVGEQAAARLPRIPAALAGQIGGR